MLQIIIAAEGVNERRTACLTESEYLNTYNSTSFKVTVKCASNAKYFEEDKNGYGLNAVGYMDAE